MSAEPTTTCIPLNTCGCKAGAITAATVAAAVEINASEGICGVAEHAGSHCSITGAAQQSQAATLTAQHVLHNSLTKYPDDNDLHRQPKFVLAHDNTARFARKHIHRHIRQQFVAVHSNSSRAQR
jgi:hypothetical protein